MNLDQVKQQGYWEDAAESLNSNFNKIGTEIDAIKEKTERSKGLFSNVEELKRTIPNPIDGDWALVGSSFPAQIYIAKGGQWIDTGETGGPEIALNDYLKYRSVDENNNVELLDPYGEVAYPKTRSVCVDHDGVTLDKVISDLNNKIISTINLPDIDLDESTILKLMYGISSTRFLVVDEGQHNCGILEVFSDNGGHGLTQIFINSFDSLVNGEILTNSHRDGKVFKYKRYYSYSNGSSDIPLKTWGPWSLIFTSDDNEILSKKPGIIVDGGEIFNHSTNSVSGGVNNHAEGQGTTCIGSCNHSEGMNTTSAGYASHSEGNGSIAGGNASHAEGVGTATSTEGGHVEGKYNKVTDSIHIVGGGTSEDDRKNLYEITKDGKVYVMNIGGYDGTNRDSAKSLNEVIDELESSGGGGTGTKVKSYSRVDLQKNLTSTTISEAEGPESALRLEEGPNIKVEKGTNGSVLISANYSSSGGDGTIIIQ